MRASDRQLALVLFAVGAGIGAAMYGAGTGLPDTAINVVKLLVTLVASVGLGAHLRYHAVEYGAPRYWDLAPVVGMAGAFVTIALFVETPHLWVRLALGVLMAVWYGLLDVATYRGESYIEQREYRLAYGPGEAWVDAFFDDDQEVPTDA